MCWINLVSEELGKHNAIASHHHTKHGTLTFQLRWAGCGRSTAAWSLLSRPFWWKVTAVQGSVGLFLAKFKDASEHHCGSPMKQIFVKDCDASECVSRGSGFVQYG